MIKRTNDGVSRARLAAGVMGTCLLMVSSFAPAGAQGVATQIMIRAVSHDGKIIGSGAGGARITVVEATTGMMLARGVQEGGTGDTDRVMREPRRRGESVYDTPGAAGFLAELTLDKPTLVRIEAEGPLGVTHATQRATKTMVLIPGIDVLGDGVVLELYGFTVELLDPVESPKDSAGEEIPIRARVTMLCGCPTEPGGLWDSSRFRIEARIVGAEGEVHEQADLTFSGEASVFDGHIHVPEGDGLSLQVIAIDAERANFGFFELPFDGEGTGQSSD